MSNITWHDHHVTKQDRIERLGQKPCVLWFTGLSGSGKSTVANALEQMLFASGVHTYLLDGDNIRHGLNKDLGFDEKSRVENIRRIGEVSKLFVDSGLIVLSAFISPYKADRQSVRQLVQPGEFVEIFIDTPLDVCESRDPKGLYKKARAGQIQNFTGLDAPYEAPDNAEVHIKNDGIAPKDAAAQIIDYLTANNYIKETANDR